LTNVKVGVKKYQFGPCIILSHFLVPISF